MALKDRWVARVNWICGWIGVRLDFLNDKRQLNGRMLYDGWIVGWLDGWMVGWLDGWIRYNTVASGYTHNP